MQLKFKKLHPSAKIPSYAYAGDAGLDLYIPEDFNFKQGETKSIALGIAIEIPEGYVGILFDKSGLSHNHGLKLWWNYRFRIQRRDTCWDDEFVRQRL